MFSTILVQARDRRKVIVAADVGGFSQIAGIGAADQRSVPRYLRKSAYIRGKIALGPASAVGRFAARTPIAAAAQRGGIVFHDLGQGRDPSREAEALETGADSLPGFGDKSRRIDGRWCAIRLRGVAFLCGFDTPSLAAQGGQRRLRYFNTRRDIPWKESS